MPIRFTCPHCIAATEVADQYAGQMGPCSHCGKTVTVPLVSGVVPKHKCRPWMSCFVVFMLIVGCDVIGIGLAQLLPAIQAAREAHRQALCMQNLKQIGLAMHNYLQKYECFPPAFIPGTNDKPKHSWRVLILPFLEQEALYRKYRFDEPWNGPHNRELAAQMPAIYHCPTHATTGSETSYAMLVGPPAISDGPTPRKPSEITDGSSNTIMVAEAVDAHINWLEPRDLNTGKMTFRVNSFNSDSEQIASDISSDHLNVANVLFCDGSVRSVRKDIEPKRLKALTTIDGGESVNIDDLR